nr:hypothetical protein [Mucilaginibacter sp. FT3.2]
MGFTELIGLIYQKNILLKNCNIEWLKQVSYTLHIYLLNSKLVSKKDGQGTVLPCLPILAPEAGHNSSQLVTQLKILSDLQVA